MKVNLKSEKSLEELKNLLEKKKLEFETNTYDWIDSFRMELGEKLNTLENDYGKIKLFETPHYHTLSSERFLYEAEIIIPDFFEQLLDYIEFKKDDDFEHNNDYSLDYRIRMNLRGNQTYLSLEMVPSSFELKDDAHTLSLTEVVKIFDSVKDVSTEIEDTLLKYAKMYSLNYESPFNYNHIRQDNPNQLNLISKSD